MNNIKVRNPVHIPRRELFNRKLTLVIRTHHKETNTFYSFVCLFFFSFFPQSVHTAGFARGEALRPLRTDLSPSRFNKNLVSFKIRYKNREYLDDPDEDFEKHISSWSYFCKSGSIPKKQTKKKRIESASKRILSFVTSSGFAKHQENTDEEMTT